MIIHRKGAKGGSWYLRRRVPARYLQVAETPSGEIWKSLRSDSESQARKKADMVWDRLVEGWEAKLAGQDAEGLRQLEAARNLAAARSLRYLPAEDVARLPTEELVRRVEMVGGTEKKSDVIDARAFLGGAKTPTIRISDALDLYWELGREKTLGKSPDQLRRWRNPRIKAIRNLVDVIGDKPIHEIDGDDMLDFRGWWLERIENEKLDPGSANKDLTHLGDVLRTVNRMKRLGLVLPLSDLAFRKGERATRLPFSDKWIREVILKPGALDGLNVEARNILRAMVNTGCRLSEVANLQPEHIRLDAEVPHISIEPSEKRHLKTANSRRVIPLTGVSLTAMRECPQGFPRYHDKPGLSATVNSFMRENGLMETPEHTVYGLRHSFEDRLLAAGVDERIRRDLMGHALTRERYGKGASLEHKQQILQATAL